MKEKYYEQDNCNFPQLLLAAYFDIFFIDVRNRENFLFRAASYGYVRHRDFSRSALWLDVHRFHLAQHVQHFHVGGLRFLSVPSGRFRSCFQPAVGGFYVVGIGIYGLLRAKRLE